MGAASTAAQRIASIRREGKRVSAADAVRLIRDRDTVASGGFVGIELNLDGVIACTNRCTLKVDAWVMRALTRT